MRIEVACGDIQTFEADVLILKHAGGFRGADAAISARIGVTGGLSAGELRIVPGGVLAAKQVAYFGVGPLGGFRYEEIKEFGRRVIETLSDRGAVGGIAVNRVVMTAHGARAGLDEKEAFLSLVSGLLLGAALARSLGSRFAPEVATIVERERRRAETFAGLLDDLNINAALASTALVEIPALQTVGRASEQKPVLFAAMPFAERYYDEYEIAFREASERAGFLCERMDLEVYVGDVLEEVKGRIARSAGVIALLNDNNPNVFLEVGYAWAKEKPTILVLRRGETPPFNVQGQRFLEYASITDLRSQLSETLDALKRNGVLGQ